MKIKRRMYNILRFSLLNRPNCNSENSGLQNSYSN